MSQFKQILEIVILVAIPAAVIIMLLFSIFRYQKKQQARKRHDALIEDEIIQSEPDNTDQLHTDSTTQVLQPGNVVLENSLQPEIIEAENSTSESISTEIQTNISIDNSNNPYMDNNQLQHKVASLEESLISERKQKEINAAEIKKLENLIKEMEMSATNSHHEIADSRAMQQELKETAASFVAQKNKWLAHLEQLNTDLKQEKEKSRQLEELLSKDKTASPAEVNINEQPTLVVPDETADLKKQLSDYREQLATIRSQLIEQQSAKDLLEEKNLQIGFLQNQLEQRIKSFHQLEYQRYEVSNHLKDLQHKFAKSEEESSGVRNELQLKTAEAITLRSHVDDHTETIRLLTNKLATETSSNESLKNKLSESGELLLKIYKELGKNLSPVSLQEPVSLKHQENGFLVGDSREAHVTNGSIV